MDVHEPPGVPPSIEVTEDGPYHVVGLPVNRVRPVTSDQGEPIGLETVTSVDVEDECWLCRCGHSLDKPFCDGTHAKVRFNGAESAPTGDYSERAKIYKGATITVRDDRAICEHAGFCNNQMTSVWKMLAGADLDDGEMRRRLLEMVERCPSGSLTYSLEGSIGDVEPQLDMAVDVIDDGPYHVTGGVRVTRSDGAPFEVRNRVTLCRCGRSSNKPLCDGTHRQVGFSDAAW